MAKGLSDPADRALAYVRGRTGHRHHVTSTRGRRHTGGQKSRCERGLSTSSGPWPDFCPPLWRPAVPNRHSRGRPASAALVVYATTTRKAVPHAVRDLHGWRGDAPPHDRPRPPRPSNTSTPGPRSPELAAYYGNGFFHNNIFWPMEDTQAMVDLYRQRFEHYGHGRADQAIVGLGGQVFMRRTRRAPSPSSVPTSTTRRSTATGPSARWPSCR